MKTTRTTDSVKPSKARTSGAKSGTSGDKPASAAPAKLVPGGAAAGTEPSSKPSNGRASSERPASNASASGSGATGAKARPARSPSSRSSSARPAESAGAASSGWWGTASAAGSVKRAGATSVESLKQGHSVPASGVDAMHAIYERRAVREYTGTKPSKDTIRKLLDAAVQAPSAMDLQPWAFVVVQDPALLDRLSERSKKLSLQHMKPGSGLSLHRRELEDPKFSVFHDAGTLVAVVARPGEWPAVEDCCLAAQNLMLAAHAMGLGTCPIGFAREALNEPAAKQELGIPADHTVAMAIVVGYPKSQPPLVTRHEARMLAWR